MPSPQKPSAVNWRPNTFSDLALLGVIFLLVIFGAVGLLYAANLKHEVSDLRVINRKLLDSTSQQREIAQQQLEINKNMLTIQQQQLNINQQLLDISSRQLAVSTETLALSRDMDAKLSTSLGLQQQLLATARATLQQAQDINRKTPSVPGTATLSSLNF
jgi:hypothetical protein